MHDGYIFVLNFYPNLDETIPRSASGMQLMSQLKQVFTVVALVEVQFD